MADTFLETRANVYDLNSTAYLKSRLDSQYSRDEGVLVIPVMGPAGTAPALIRVHAPLGFRTVDFEYQRVSQPPVFPAQADTNSGDVILGSKLVLPAPIESEQNLVFACRGQYEFVQYDVLRGPDDPYPIDRHPFPTLVDALGQLKNNGGAKLVTPDAMSLASEDFRKYSQGGPTGYNTSVMDSRFLSSYGILG